MRNVSQNWKFGTGLLKYIILLSNKSIYVNISSFKNQIILTLVKSRFFSPPDNSKPQSNGDST